VPLPSPCPCDVCDGVTAPRRARPRRACGIATETRLFCLDLFAWEYVRDGVRVHAPADRCIDPLSALAHYAARPGIDISSIGQFHVPQLKQINIYSYERIVFSERGCTESCVHWSTVSSVSVATGKCQDRRIELNRMGSTYAHTGLCVCVFDW
jgi:hypothetical protein